MEAESGKGEARHGVGIHYVCPQAAWAPGREGVQIHRRPRAVRERALYKKPLLFSSPCVLTYFSVPQFTRCMKSDISPAMGIQWLLVEGYSTEKTEKLYKEEQ